MPKRIKAFNKEEWRIENTGALSLWINKPTDKIKSFNNKIATLQKMLRSKSSHLN